MKMTKFFALAGTAALLFGMAGCKTESGTEYGNTSGKKYALTMTVDYKKNKDGSAYSKYDASESKNIVDVVTDSKTQVKIEDTGVRFFKDFSSGVDNNMGFRTNIVINTKESNLTNSDKNRYATFGIFWDKNDYKGSDDKKVYDFFGLIINPKKKMAYLDRYYGVKTTKDGVYCSDVGSIGNSYCPTDATATTWKPCKDNDDGTGSSGNSAYSVDITDALVEDEKAGTITIGVDVHQLTAGQYTVKIGKIAYNTGNFDDATSTTFTVSNLLGVCGDPAGTSDITGYEHWTHYEKKDENLLEGGACVYGFVPYGCKLVATYNTLNSKAANATTAAIKKDGTSIAGKDADWVYDWNIAPDADTSSTKTSYAEGYQHDYVEY